VPSDLQVVRTVETRDGVVTHTGLATSEVEQYLVENVMKDRLCVK
jgi:hypothetical protein